jgi:hypothetical protein
MAALVASFCAVGGGALLAPALGQVPKSPRFAGTFLASSATPPRPSPYSSSPTPGDDGDSKFLGEKEVATDASKQQRKKVRGAP